MRNYEELKVYQMSETLVVEVYKSTQTFPSEERFGLTAHLRKTALSIPSNIAEGSGRNGDREYYNFLNIAIGSANELECQLQIAYRLDYLTEHSLNTLKDTVIQIRKMLFAIMRGLRQQVTRSEPRASSLDTRRLK